MWPDAIYAHGVQVDRVDRTLCSVLHTINIVNNTCGLDSLCSNAALHCNCCTHVWHLDYLLARSWRFTDTDTMF